MSLENVVIRIKGNSIPLFTYRLLYHPLHWKSNLIRLGGQHRRVYCSLLLPYDMLAP